MHSPFNRFFALASSLGCGTIAHLCNCRPDCRSARVERTPAIEIGKSRNVGKRTGAEGDHERTQNSSGERRSLDVPARKRGIRE